MRKLRKISYKKEAKQNIAKNSLIKMRNITKKRAWLGSLFIIGELLLLTFGIITHLNQIYISGWPTYSTTMDHIIHIVKVFYDKPLKDMYYTLFKGPINVILGKEISQQPTLKDLPYKEVIIKAHPELKILNRPKFNYTSAALLRTSDYNLLYVIYKGIISYVMKNDIIKLNLFFLIAIFTLGLSSFFLFYKETKQARLSIIVANTFIISNFIFYQYTLYDSNLFTIFPMLFFIYSIEKIRSNPEKKSLYWLAGLWFGIQLLSSAQLSLMLIYLILIRELLLMNTPYSLLKLIGWKNVIVAIVIASIIAFPQLLISYISLVFTPNSPINNLQVFVKNVRGASFHIISELFCFSCSHSLSFTTWILTSFLIIYNLHKKRWQYPLLIGLIISFSFGFADWNIIYKAFAKLPLFAAFRTTRRFVVFIPFFNFAELVNMFYRARRGEEPLIMRMLNSKVFIWGVFISLLILDLIYARFSFFIGQNVFFDPYK